MAEIRVSLVNALSWAISANFLARLMNIIGLIAFARLLGVTVIGEYGFILVTLELLTLFFNFGFNQAAVKYGGDQEIFSAAFALVILQSLALLLAFATIGVTMSLLINSKWGSWLPGLVLVLAKILGFFTTLSYAPLQSQLQYRVISTATVVSTATGLGAALILSTLVEPNVYVLVARDFVIAVLMFLLVFRKCPLRFMLNYRTSAIKTVWQFTRPIWYLTLLERGALRADYVLAAATLDQVSFGVYFQVRAIIEGVLGFAVGPIQTVVYAYYCRTESRMLLYNRMIRHWIVPISVLAVVLFLFLSLSNVGYDFVEFLYGSEWRDGGALLAGLGTYACGIFVFEHTKVLAMAEGQSRVAVVARICQLVFLGLTVVPLIYLYGLYGAGIASGLGAIVLYGVSTVLLHRATDRMN